MMVMTNDDRDIKIAQRGKDRKCEDNGVGRGRTITKMGNERGAEEKSERTAHPTK